MAALPAFCGSCGLIFPSLRFSRNFRDADTRGLELPCPRCGAMAEISTRAFDVVEGTVEMLSPDPRPERLQLLLDELLAIRRAQAEASDPRYPTGGEVPTLMPTLDGLSPDVQRVVAFFLETVVKLLISQSAARQGRPPLKPQDVREAAAHALEHQRIFPR